METVRVSPKYQVVIPKSVREAARIKSGQEMAVIHYRGRVELIPIGVVREMRGFLRGVDPAIDTEEDREL